MKVGPHALKPKIEPKSSQTRFASASRAGRAYDGTLELLFARWQTPKRSPRHSRDVPEALQSGFGPPSGSPRAALGIAQRRPRTRLRRLVDPFEAQDRPGSAPRPILGAPRRVPGAILDRFWSQFSVCSAHGCHAIGHAHRRCMPRTLCNDMLACNGLPAPTCLHRPACTALATATTAPTLCISAQHVSNALQRSADIVSPVPRL